MVIPFLALSFLALSFVLYFKQSDPINFFINTVISIFSGIIYPVSVLPSSMQNISNRIPLTSQLNSARQILINNSFDDYIFSNLFYFHILFSVFFLFACIYVFNVAVYLVKKEVQLAHIDDQSLKISENITFESIDENIYIVNIDNGEYYKLSKSASLIWKVESGVDIKEIKIKLKSSFSNNDNIDSDVEEV